MFKAENFENELMQQMEKNLVHNEVENRWSFDKIAKAAEYISFAAEIFDDTGMHKEAEMLTRMLEKIATSESSQLVRNMKETGTVFPKKSYKGHSKDNNKLSEGDEDRYAGEIEKLLGGDYGDSEDDTSFVVDSELSEIENDNDDDFED